MKIGPLDGRTNFTTTLVGGASAFRLADNYQACISAGNWIQGNPGTGSCGWNAGSATVSFGGGRVSVAYNVAGYIVVGHVNVACNPNDEPSPGQMVYKSSDPVCPKDPRLVSDRFAPRLENRLANCPARTLCSVTVGGALPSAVVSHCPTSFWMIIHTSAWHSINENRQCKLESDYCH
jgi:hypothetical protein